MTNADYAERFWSHVDKSGDCWLWTGGKTQYGYGQFGIVAHRVAYELEVSRGCRICLAWNPEKTAKQRAYRARKREERAS